MRTLKILPLVVICMLSVLSCEQDGMEAQPNKTIDADAKRIYGVVNGSNTLKSQLVLYVQLDQTKALPSMLYLNGKMLVDDGTGFDVKAKDGIYSSVNLSESKLANLKAGDVFEVDMATIAYKDRQAGSARTSDEQPCEAGFFADGAETPCGTCPAKSILGYDTWFCICITQSCYDWL